MFLAPTVYTGTSTYILTNTYICTGTSSYILTNTYICSGTSILIPWPLATYIHTYVPVPLFWYLDHYLHTCISTGTSILSTGGSFSPRYSSATVEIFQQYSHNWTKFITFVTFQNNVFLVTFQFQESKIVHIQILLLKLKKDYLNIQSSHHGLEKFHR